MLLVGWICREGNVLTVDFSDSAVDVIVRFVHVHVLHTVLLPFVQDFEYLASALDVRSVQGYYSRGGFDLEDASEPVLACSIGPLLARWFLGCWLWIAICHVLL